MSKIRALAGQTVSYGLSSIVARIFNYLLTPLHTGIFHEAEFGVIGNLYAYVAFMNILLTFGMETTYFRFSTKYKTGDIYHIAATTVMVISLLVSAFIILNAQTLALWTKNPEYGHVIRWLGIIIFLDAVTAIPFAKLRLENKVKYFVLVKIINISILVILNLVFLLLFPAIEKGELFSFLKPVTTHFYNEDLRIGYVFFANLIASASLLILLWKPISEIKIKFDWQQFKPMLLYTLPILITGFAGTINDQFDKILIPFLIPEQFYTHSPDEALGVYNAAFKLSVFMVLATQAFRYAGEPFFFSNVENKDAPELFARILYYFIVAAVALFIGVSLNLDLLAFIFIRDTGLRAAIYLVPLLLLGKMFYGIYVNLSIWFKITDKTYFGTYFALTGALITLAANFLLIPVIGYNGSAIACVLCYFAMCVMAYLYGRKFFPIPYDLKSGFGYILLGIIVAWLSFQINLEDFITESVIKLVVSLLLVGGIILFERKNLKRLSNKGKPGNEN